MTPPESIAHYRIISKLGEGGMGTVYRATDTKLGREVAIKVLPEVFASDPARMARLEREAQVLASLNHPNIAAIYGIETGAIVMELVEGADLAGPLPADTAIHYARQIASGLEAPRARRGPSRPQAGQHQGHAGGRGEGARFRVGLKIGILTNLATATLISWRHQRISSSLREIEGRF